jgi:transcriptional regulator with XRE-family HTH domain
MEPHDLWTAIRSRARTRGMTLAQLARAAGMSPNNLRRLLSDHDAAPRLATVMRLLPPLHAAIAPAGARTPAELAAFLEDERIRRGASWGALLGRRDATSTLSRRLRKTPDALPLDLVMRLADALHVELAVIDEGAASAKASAPQPPGEDETIPPDLPEDAPKNRPPGPSLSHGPFRPPRLGRYRDVLIEPRPSPTRDHLRTNKSEEQPPSPDASGRSTPRARSLLSSMRVQAHELVSGLSRVADREWMLVYDLLHIAKDGGPAGADATKRFSRAMCHGLAELRRLTAPSPPPFVPGRARPSFDPDITSWIWAKYSASARLHRHDDAAPIVPHITIDRGHILRVESAPIGSVAHLYSVGPLNTDLTSTDHHVFTPPIPLQVLHRGHALVFTHVDTGPICGVIERPSLGEDRHLFLVAVGWSLAIVENVRGRSRVLWHGAAEELRDLDLGGRIEHFDVEVPARPTAPPPDRPARPQHRRRRRS